MADLVIGEMRDGLAVHDREGRLVTWNRAAASITGWSEEEARHRFPADVPDGLVDLENGRWIEVRHMTARTFARGEVGVTLFTDARANVALRDAFASLETVSTTDPLTGLANRALAEDRLRVSAMIARRDHRLMAVLCVDLDRFNLVNDTLGHTSGDEILRGVATRLRDCIRESDTAARIGGDEFVVILHEISCPEDAERLASEILASLERPIDAAGQELYVSASVGVAICPDHGLDAGGLLQAAHLALQHAKRDGGRAFRLYARALSEHSRERMIVAAELHRALARSELEVYYQPQVDIDTGRVVGAEALVRWNHPERGLVPPVRFLPIAEEDGLIVEIDRWVLRGACNQLRQWDDQGLELPMVSVNLSARTFASEDTAALVTEALAETGLMPERLEIEVSEQVVADQAGAERKVAALKSLGVQVAIDDFGTGYSSLGHLKRFSFDTIKLDRSFVVDVTGQPRPADIAILRAVVTMAADLGLRCIAEGVETAAQRKVLRFLRCHLVQGYLHGAPVPAAALATTLLRLPLAITEPTG